MAKNVVGKYIILHLRSCTESKFFFQSAEFQKTFLKTFIRTKNYFKKIIAISIATLARS